MVHLYVLGGGEGGREGGGGGITAPSRVLKVTASSMIFYYIKSWSCTVDYTPVQYVSAGNIYHI